MRINYSNMHISITICNYYRNNSLPQFHSYASGIFNTTIIIPHFARLSLLCTIFILSSVRNINEMYEIVYNSKYVKIIYFIDKRQAYENEFRRWFLKQIFLCTKSAILPTIVISFFISIKTESAEYKVSDRTINALKIACSTAIRFPLSHFAFYNKDGRK